MNESTQAKVKELQTEIDGLVSSLPSPKPREKIAELNQKIA